MNTRPGTRFICDVKEGTKLIPLGDGRILIAHPDEMQRIVYFETCADCEGVGFSIKGTCKTCDGFGKQRKIKEINPDTPSEDTAPPSARTSEADPSPAP